jgi:hypothetical protein
MPTIGETGFVSKEQEEYIRITNPTMYKAIIKQHGHFKPKRKEREPDKRKVMKKGR